jgi:hypothetical protein
MSSSLITSVESLFFSSPSFSLESSSISILLNPFGPPIGAFSSDEDYDAGVGGAVFFTENSSGFRVSVDYFHQEELSLESRTCTFLGFSSSILGSSVS